MELFIDGIREGEIIPNRYTCNGAGLSPEITWDKLPPNTQSLALIMDDPDAPRGTFTHWLIWNIPSTAVRLQTNMARKAELPNGIRQGVNSGGTYGFYPSCPPPGPAHRYIYRLLALDNITALTAGASRDQFDQAVNSHILVDASITGLFSR